MTTNLDTGEIDMLALRVATHVNGGRAKCFLGLDLGAYTKMAISLLAVILVAVAAWHLTVRDALQVRPTLDQTEELLGRHEERGQHPAIDARIKSIEQDQTTIRESQVRQEQIDKNQTKLLDEIKTDVKRLGRRRSR